MGGDGPGIGGVDEEFVDLEPAFAGLLDPDAEDAKHGCIEVPRIGEVPRPQMHMVDETAGMPGHARLLQTVHKQKSPLARG